MSLLAWQRGGAAMGPALVCCHPVGADGPSTFGPTGWVEAAGAAGVAIYVMDLAGHGDSAGVAPPGGVNPAAWTAKAAAEDLTRMGVHRFVALGAGDGSLTAAALAASNPERATGLVLAGTDDSEGVEGGTALADLLADRRGVWHAEAAERAAELRRDRRHDPLVLAAWAEHAVWPAAPRLGSMHIPVLIAVAAEDTHRRARVSRLAALFHDGHVVTIPGAADDLLASPALHRQALDLVTTTAKDTS